MNNAILLQQCYTANGENTGVFYDMLRLTMQRHAAYTRAWNMDFQLYFGDYVSDRSFYTGAWHKIKMIQDALDRGYQYAFWLDTDAAIVDFNVDLRTAFTGDGIIGACLHDANGIPPHLNVGVLFVMNSDKTKDFLQKWWDSFPGERQWMEQGEFNKLKDKYRDIVFRMDDRFNATVNVNECENPAIKGWHGVPLLRRYEMMKQFFRDDHIRYRV